MASAMAGIDRNLSPYLISSIITDLLCCLVSVVSFNLNRLSALFYDADVCRRVQSSLQTGHQFRLSDVSSRFYPDHIYFGRTTTHTHTHTHDINVACRVHYV